MRYLIFCILLINTFFIKAQEKSLRLVDYNKIVGGDARLNQYLPLLIGKRVAVVANHASMVQNTYLVDTLLQLQVDVVKIFSPEHGFFGNQAAGKAITNSLLKADRIVIVSLYGKKKKPDSTDLQGVDVMVFDLQDVGVRFYTYISTLSLVMEACAENNIPMIVLDRPNPNGFYVDGPVLKPGFRSFVGMHPVPTVYGMTIGEYARMLNGEGWLKNSVRCDLTVISLKHYTHNEIVKLPVKPSPNLPNWRSVYLYPSLCFFEGTIVSVGRGTSTPFQVYGHPDLSYGNYVFTPQIKDNIKPKLSGQQCFGQNLAGYAENYRKNPRQLNLSWLINAYKNLKDKHAFFNAYFDKLAGTDSLRRQIENGTSEKQIRRSWQNDLNKFLIIRKKYLLYP